MRQRHWMAVLFTSCVSCLKGDSLIDTDMRQKSVFESLIRIIAKTILSIIIVILID